MTAGSSSNEVDFGSCELIRSISSVLENGFSGFILRGQLWRPCFSITVKRHEIDQLDVSHQGEGQNDRFDIETKTTGTLPVIKRPELMGMAQDL